MLAERARLLVATLWVGSLWTIGGIVAPVVFKMTPTRELAGAVAGSLFRIEAWLSVACAIILFVSLSLTAAQGSERHKATRYLIVAMLLCTVVGYFGLQPVMSSLRELAAVAGNLPSDSKTRFMLVHGVAGGLYLTQCLLGSALILKLR